MQLTVWRVPIPVNRKPVSSGAGSIHAVDIGGACRFAKRAVARFVP
ncbi:hypothetical protein PQR02_38125 [Paraburkholderia sediminicola]|uniref:Uncharacterized protein n=1 Tax=Paraburkholderia rhynchosiae TaxID=487049 RepID=A0ACC7NPJ3_9BURK